MTLSDLWLEDLFRVHLGTREPLDRGPFQARPYYSWSSREFGSDEEIRRTIEGKLTLKRNQGAVDVLGYYVRFIHDARRVGASEPRRQTLRDLIRYPRVYIRDAAAYQRGISALLENFRVYERAHWSRHRVIAEQSVREGDRIGIWGAYSGALEFFIKAIREIMNTTSESILGQGPVVKMEVDFEIHPPILETPGFLRSPHAVTREASAEAKKAWNALQAQQRSGLASRQADTDNALRAEYDSMHSRRRIPDPNLPGSW
jgi:hypothetical protein